MAYSTRSDYSPPFTLAILHAGLIEDIRWWDTIFSWLDRRCPLTGSLPGVHICGWGNLVTPKSAHLGSPGNSHYIKCCSYTIWEKAPDLWMMLVFLFTISIANLMISLNATVSQTWQNLPYRTLYAFPYLAVWLTAGFMALKKPAYLLSIILVGVYSVGIYNYFTGKQFIQPIYTVPWREIFSSITAVSTPDTLVICSHGDFACPYYSQRYGFGSHTAEDWVNLSGQTYSQVWWIQSNLGASLKIYVNETEIFQEIRNRYKDSIEYHFAPQDPTIRWIKTTLLNRDDYEYRVDVYRFGQPIQR